MSLGLQALRAVVDAGSVTAFRQLHEDWLLDDELPAFSYVRNHLRRYGNIPDANTCRDNGVRLPTVQQPLQYYMDKLTQRATFNGVNAAYPQLIEHMKARDMQGVRTVLQEMTQAARVLDNGRSHSTMVEQGELVLSAYSEAKMRPGMQGITLGDPILDEVTNGAQPGDVIIYAGRPNVGKSYLLCHSALAGWGSRRPAAICTMEMHAQQLATRCTAMLAQLDPDLIRKGQLSTLRGEPRLREIVRGYQNLPPLYFLEGSFRKTVGDVDNFVQECSPDILYIDSGYLLKPENLINLRNYSKRDIFGEVITGIKEMAEDRRIPVVMTVQLNRQASKAQRKLDLTHIAESDDFGRVASVVMAIEKGLAPRQDITRELQMVKNRDGRLVTYQKNFLFAPMDFNYIPGSEYNEELTATGSDDTQDIQRQIERTTWGE